MGVVALICPEPIRSVVQGIGIRFLEMAAELGHHHAVSLWVPNRDFPRDLPFKVLPFPDRDFADRLRDVDVVVIHGHISERYFQGLELHSLGKGPPLVIDLYDPFLIENLRYTEVLGDEVFYRDRQVLFRQLASGDFFLVSSESQRLFYIGVLTGVGRLHPQLYQSDRTLRSLIDVAPFGVRPGEPGDQTEAHGSIRGVIPGIGPDDLVLFFGGVYDWYDPALLLHVLSGLFNGWPTLRVIFSVNPNQDTTPQAKFRELRWRSDQQGWTGRHVFFIPWFPYRERFSYLRDVDLAVSVHEPSLETDLSLRTRILEYLNAGLPVIATEGGESARILGSSGAGMLVPAGDLAAVSGALVSLLERPDLRRSLGQKGQHWVRKHMTWEASLKPLLAFCSAPRKASMAPEALLPHARVDGRALSRAYRYWRRRGSVALVRRIAQAMRGGGWS